MQSKSLLKTMLLHHDNDFLSQIITINLVSKIFKILAYLAFKVKVHSKLIPVVSFADSEHPQDFSCNLSTMPPVSFL